MMAFVASRRGWALSLEELRSRVPESALLLPLSGPALAVAVEVVAAAAAAPKAKAVAKPKAKGKAAAKPTAKPEENKHKAHQAVCQERMSSNNALHYVAQCKSDEDH